MPDSNSSPHSRFDDVQALLVAPLFVALGVLLFQNAGLFTGGTVGIAFLIHYLTHWPIGLVVFVINLPFYLLAVRVLGWAFTLKTFVAVTLLSVFTEALPALIDIQSLDRVFAAVMGGFLIGVGLLFLIRHKASLGGLSIVAVHLQNSRGWRAGVVQGIGDIMILAAGVFVRDPLSVGLSIVGALALNLIIAVNHKSGRYMGV